MANPRAQQARLGDALGYAPEELARLESELSSLTLGNVRDLMGSLQAAREELAREAHGA